MLNGNLFIAISQIDGYTISILISLEDDVFMFTKDTIIYEVLEKAPQAAPAFFSIGMHCLGCAMASGETIEQACAVHGVNVDDFLASLNELVEKAV